MKGIRMNFKKAFTYIFEDQRWFEKLIVPLLVTLIPVVGGMATVGYIMRVTRNVAANQAAPLPQFEFGTDLRLGFKMFVAGFVYMLPVMLIYLIIMLPLSLIGDSDAMTGIVALVGIFVILLILAYGLLLAVMMPVITAKVAVQQEIKAAFQFKDIFRRLKNNFTAWLIAIGGAMLCGAVIAPLGGIVLVIGAFITGFYSQLIIAHLNGQAYAHSQNPGGQGAPVY